LHFRYHDDLDTTPEECPRHDRWWGRQTGAHDWWGLLGSCGSRDCDSPKVTSLFCQVVSSTEG